MGQNRRTFLTRSGMGALGMIVGIPSSTMSDFSENGLEPSAEKNYQFSRSIPVGDVYDLVVTGGGPAGTAAAICAARLGAKVLLVEAMGCLGGMSTSGYVCAFDPMANGERMLVGGFMKEIVETLYSRGFMSPGINPNSWRKNDHNWSPFQPEGLKIVFDEKVVEAGVHVVFFTKVIGADTSNEKINGVILSNVEGLKYIKAKMFIDATGDAVLSDLCGVQYREAGRDTEKIMPATLASLFSGMDWSKPSFPTQSPIGVEMIEKEFAAGNFFQCDRHLVGISKIGETVGYLNGGHIFDQNAVNVESLTQGMMTGRKVVQECQAFLRKYSENCENMELVSTAPVMGVRESRRILGEYELSFNDIMTKRQFPDQIGVFSKFIDIHPYDCTKEEHERFLLEKDKTGRLGKGDMFGIPYSILVPKGGWKNLWVAGRCSSSDVMAHGSIRVQPSCSMMGQAAGTAAVQSIQTGQPAYDINTETLIKTLRDADAFLPQEKLSKKMTIA